jgi:hypothetical protein
MLTGHEGYTFGRNWQIINHITEFPHEPSCLIFAIQEACKERGINQ